MAKKEVADVVVAELKKLFAEGKLVLGTDETLKGLRKKKVNKVFLAANCDPVVKEDIERLCALGSVACVQLAQSNEEVGVICKKPFAIAVVGVI